MNSLKLIIGTRGSDLALYQANFIQDILIREMGCSVEIKIIKTAGDKFDQLSFDKMEGKGFFTKELEDALLNREIDLAVHSLKDLMTTQPEGLKLGAVGFRADRREMLLINKDATSDGSVLPVRPDGIIGTSSTRRKCQIARLAPSLKIKDLRGNVPTRVNKVREGQYDAIVIAAAGVTRLNLDLSDLEIVLLEPDIFLPAPAQGVLGIQIRSNDNRIEQIISLMNSEESVKEVALERGLLQKFDAGCSLPLGVYSQIMNNNYQLSAILGIRQGDDGDNWIGLKSVKIDGDNIEDIVNRAFDELNK